MIPDAFLVAPSPLVLASASINFAVVPDVAVDAVSVAAFLSTREAMITD